MIDFVARGGNFMCSSCAMPAVAGVEASVKNKDGSYVWREFYCKGCIKSMNSALRVPHPQEEK